MVRGAFEERFIDQGSNCKDGHKKPAIEPRFSGGMENEALNGPGGYRLWFGTDHDKKAVLHAKNPLNPVLFKLFNQINMHADGNHEPGLVQQ